VGEILFSAIAWVFNSLVGDVLERFIGRHWKLVLGGFLFLVVLIVVLASI